jgi:two-component sensor histidine kinase
MDLDIDIPRDMSAPAMARAAVRALSGTLDGDVLSDTTLLVSELISNSVKYGEGAIELRVRTRGTHHVLVEVLDEGDGFAPGERRRSRFESGGFGLQLVEQLSSSWGIHAAKTHVWFEIDRSADLAAVA